MRRLAQQNLFEGEEPEKRGNGEFQLRTKSGIPLDLAISGLQKEIRRGNVENAVFLVQDLVLAGFIRYAYRRLAIIAAEDCSADPLATIMVHACYENDRMSSQDFKKANEGVCITQAVVYLCRCKKSRFCDDLWCYLMEMRKRGAKPEVKDYFKDGHTKAGREMGRGEEYWFRESSKIVNEEGENPYRAKLMELYGFKGEESKGEEVYCGGERVKIDPKLLEQMQRKEKVRGGY